MFFKVFFSSCMQSNLKTFPKTFLTYPLVLPVLRKHSYRLDNWSSHFLRQSITSQRTHRNLHPKNLSRKRFFNWDNPSGLVRSGAKLVPLSAWHDYTRRPLLLCPLIAKIHFICHLCFTNTFLASFFNFLIFSMFMTTLDHSFFVPWLQKYALCAIFLLYVLYFKFCLSWFPVWV